ncbi:MAG: TonB-dependent receptor domain-containing protein, partial [Mangrovibacterium sp.]
ILPSDALGIHNTSNGTKVDSSFGTSDSHQTADGLMARAFYSYDDRYMFTATIRRDGYSAFGASNPYAYFPSFAFGWNFKEESFVNWDALSTGKLRLSWGKNGNRALSDPYISIANLGSGTGATMGYIDPSTGEMVEMKYLGIDRLENPNLQWEKTSSLNMGVDYGFLNDRITGALDVYFTQTHDMIMSQRLPGFSGFSSIATNLGEVDNRGFELSINTVNITNRHFEWTTNFAFSYNKNEIKSLYGDMEDVVNDKGEVIGQKEADDISNGWFIGHPIGEIWNYQTVGIWQKDEVEEAARYGQQPGDPKIANRYTQDDKVNSDGTVTPVYNDNDKVFMGQTSPPINWSIRNDFKYKNWEASINIYSYMGHKSLNGEFMNGFDSGSLYKNNYNPFVSKYWTVDNPTNEYARLNAQAPAGASAYKLINRNFIRLDNISIAYTLPKAITSRWNMDRVKFSASIRNVGTWAKEWEYGDPETGGLATRTFNFGVDVTL